jgi:hypothetical protein
MQKLKDSNEAEDLKITVTMSILNDLTSQGKIDDET